MAWPVFSGQSSPIAIDFGYSSVKLLQLGSGERPVVLAAAELQIPIDIRTNPAKRFEYVATSLPKVIRKGNFKGKRVVCSITSDQTIVQHMQLTTAEGVKIADQIKTQLQVQMGCSPDSVVVRHVNVGDFARAEGTKTEIICFAMARSTVMRCVELLNKCRLNVTGAHTPQLAMVRAFDHLNRREGDDSITTIYVDFGNGGTKVAIGHGRKLVFAKQIDLGGIHFDQLIADALHCDLESAIAHRLSNEPQLIGDALPQSRNATPKAEGMSVLSAGLAKNEKRGIFGKSSAAVAEERRSGATPDSLSEQLQPRQINHDSKNPVDFSELLDTLVDELSMCLRYHSGLFRKRQFDRMIFLGGEARQVGLCQHVARELRLPAQLGDPLARLDHSAVSKHCPIDFAKPNPGWAVAYGLCASFDH